MPTGGKAATGACASCWARSGGGARRRRRHMHVRSSIVPSLLSVSLSFPFRSLLSCFPIVCLLCATWPAFYSKSFPTRLLCCPEKRSTCFSSQSLVNPRIPASKSAPQLAYIGRRNCGKASCIGLLERSSWGSVQKKRGCKEPCRAGAAGRRVGPTARLRAAGAAENSFVGRGWLKRGQSLCCCGAKCGQRHAAGVLYRQLAEDK